MSTNDKRKTRKTRGSASKKSMLECCNATYHGLHEWHKAMFEELGWMILAKSHGMKDKITTYKNSLARLKWSLEQKLQHTMEEDRKQDLEILHHNLMILIEHANKDL